jgi:hypothetical protein
VILGGSIEERPRTLLGNRDAIVSRQTIAMLISEEIIMSNNVVLKDDAKNKKYKTLYVKNAKVYYPCVHRPKKAYQSEDKEYSITVFVDEDSKDALEEEVHLNKEFFLVGKTKNKKKVVKFKAEDYPECEGLWGFTLTQPAKSKAGKNMSVTVVDKAGNKFEEDIGNGSVCTVKCMGWHNDDGLLTARLNLVQVLEHVPYEGGAGGVVEDDELGISYEIQYADAGEDSAAKAVTDDSAPFDTEDDDDYI